jgi:hypothetical protein
MEKISLPIKTKIVAWWMIIFFFPSFFIDIQMLGWLIDIFWPKGNREGIGVLVLVLLILPIAGISFLVNFISGIFLLKRRKKAWKVLIVKLCVYLIISVILFVNSLYLFILSKLSTTSIYLFIDEEITWWFIVLCLYLIPFVFLLLDRKNFFKIAS